MTSIAFDPRLRGYVLDLFGKKIDDSGYIVEKSHPNQRVQCDGKPLRETDFAGVRKGSRIFFKNDVSSLLKVVDALPK